MNGDLTDEQVATFLIELTALSRKHGISIGGCGCCGSPYLDPCKVDGHYKVEEYGDGKYKEWSDLEWEIIEENNQ